MSDQVTNIVSNAPKPTKKVRETLNPNYSSSTFSPDELDEVAKMSQYEGVL